MASVPKAITKINPLAYIASHFPAVEPDKDVSRWFATERMELNFGEYVGRPDANIAARRDSLDGLFSQGWYVVAVSSSGSGLWKKVQSTRSESSSQNNSQEMSVTSRSGSTAKSGSTSESGSENRTESSFGNETGNSSQTTNKSGTETGNSSQTTNKSGTETGNSSQHKTETSNSTDNSSKNGSTSESADSTSTSSSDSNAHSEGTADSESGTENESHSEGKYHDYTYIQGGTSKSDSNAKGTTTSNGSNSSDGTDHASGTSTETSSGSTSINETTDSTKTGTATTTATGNETKTSAENGTTTGNETKTSTENGTTTGNETKTKSDTAQSSAAKISQGSSQEREQSNESGNDSKSASASESEYGTEIVESDGDPYWCAYSRIRLERRRMQVDAVLKDMIKSFVGSYNEGRRINAERYDEIVALYSMLVNEVQDEIDGLVGDFNMEPLFDEIKKSVDEAMRNFAKAASEIPGDWMQSRIDDINRKFDALVGKERARLVSIGMLNVTISTSVFAGIERERQYALNNLKDDMVTLKVDVYGKIATMTTDIGEKLIDAKTRIFEAMQKQKITPLEMRNTVFKWMFDYLEKRTEDYPSLGDMTTISEKLGYSGAIVAPKSVAT